MYTPSFLKRSALARLKDHYSESIICALLFIFPIYILTQILTLINYTNPNGIVLTEIITVLVKIFVLDIFEVGYIKFISYIKSGNGRHNYNILFICNYADRIILYDLTYFGDIFIRQLAPENNLICFTVNSTASVV